MTNGALMNGAVMLITVMEGHDTITFQWIFHTSRRIRPGIFRTIFLN